MTTWRRKFTSLLVAEWFTFSMLQCKSRAIRNFKVCVWYAIWKRFLTTFEDVRTELFTNAYSQLGAADVLPDDRYHKEGATVIRELLKNKSISDRKYFSLVGRKVGKELLDTNVFA